MDKTLLEEIVWVIDEEDDLTIATIRPDGFPQATTVSYINDGPTIYFCTTADSQKAQNIGQNNKVSLTINRPYETWNDIVGISLGGHAYVVTDVAEQEKVNTLLFKKFPQVVDYLPSEAKIEGEMVTFRIEPTVVSLLDYRQGFGHTDTVHFEKSMG